MSEHQFAIRNIRLLTFLKRPDTYTYGNGKLLFFFTFHIGRRHLLSTTF